MSGISASHTIDSDYLAGVGPIVCVHHEAGTDWVIAHVIPFLRVTLITPQDVIKAHALPDRVGTRSAHNAFREVLFQEANPASQFKIVRAADEEMDVIRHDDVAPDGDVVFGVRTFCEVLECVVHGVGR
jgi:hypothetical protein